MHVVVRKYSGPGSKELMELLEKSKADIVATLSKVTGFVNYTLARTDSGGFSATICQHQAGVDESTSVAREWVTKHAQGIKFAPPEVTVGTVIAHSSSR